MAGYRAIAGELSLMDKGLKSLLEVSLSSDLHTLNVHCNCIARIEGLSHLQNLQHLDLSSNQIRRIEGLDSLANLRTLSLSCNLLTKVEGLENLFNLTVLNLSYNRIHDLSGFQCLHGTGHKISHIDLHSNCVNNINHLLQCTKGLLCLTNLTLEKNGKANPVCHTAGYRETVLQTLPQLTALDGRNISGEPVDLAEENSSDLQCLEDILGCLAPSGFDAYHILAKVLIQELDQEKERRWKAEQAEKKLIEHVRELQKHAKEEKNIQSMAVYTTDRLKELILKERDVKARLQADVQQLKGETERLTDELNQARNKEAERQKAMQALEETLSKMETQRLQQRTIEVQEAELKASANEREVQLLRISFRQQKEKVKQLHELLILREQEQRKELETRVALNGPEFQAALSKEVAKEEQRHEQRVKEFQEKINISNQKYKELEDEFRLALTIEAKRFKEVKEGFENVAADLVEHKRALFEFEQKEKEMTSLIQDLTSIVKEQKAKIAELTKSNEEATANLKFVYNQCRTGELATVTEEYKQKSVQLELLKKENGKLISQLTAQESVIDGLKMERKIWGQELAQQGAHLAQDRGKLEAKIEVLMNEIETLKKQKEQDSDTIRIKNKIVDDQTETIRRLKEGLQEKDKQIRKQHEENLKTQKLFQVQLDEKAAEFEELMEKLERQKERKEELKQLLEEKEVELDGIKNAHSALKKKWQGKGELLSQLEVQVKQMKESFDIKEKKLTEERNKSLQTQRIAVEKLHEMDDAFRKQLESMLAAHQEELLQLATEKEKQIEAANEKVYYVEEEMRQLLQETANNKKAMENKIRRLTHALNDIQQDL
uniref:Leucine-rich repeat and coiled-coil domain-containing protein 1 n=1 Tax=Otus sunia TaxID=257818 RepID=A0A8C8E8N9_9STRI